MTRPAIRHRHDPEPRARAGTAVLAELAARLTPRDHQVLELVWEHRVLTTGQLTAIVFPTEGKARHRLLDLHRLTALDRFRPWTPTGSAAWHWVLGAAGAAVLAARRGVSTTELGYRRDTALAITHSPLLGHQIGVNEFFAQLHHTARTRRDSSGLVAWWPERRCAKLWGDLARPDAYGRWTQPTSAGRAEVDFLLEHDTGTEHLTRVATKLGDYANLADATNITTPVLFWLPSPRRETHLRELIGTPEVPAATAVHTSPADTDGPAGAVWLPCGTTGPRLRLIDLAAAWPAVTRQPRHIPLGEPEEVE